MRFISLILSIFFFAVVNVQAGAIKLSGAIDPVELLVVPNALHITESFKGARVTVSADIPGDAAAVVELTGAALDNHLLRKGRRGGLWMSVGEVEVTGVPSLYLAMSTPGQALDKGKVKNLGYGAIESQAQFKGSLPEGGKDILFQQFLKLKESEGMYGLFPGMLKVERNQVGLSTVTGQLRLPSSIAAGDYQIILSVVRDGKVVEQKSAKLKVDVKGLTAFLLSLARRHALLYGLLAVVVAIAAGFGMGFVFKGKSAH